MLNNPGIVREAAQMIQSQGWQRRFLRGDRPSWRSQQRRHAVFMCSHCMAVDSLKGTNNPRLMRCRDCGRHNAVKRMPQLCPNCGRKVILELRAGRNACRCSCGWFGGIHPKAVT